MSLEKTLSQIRELDREAMAKNQARLDILTKPPGSLGVLEEISLKLAGITGNPMPTIGDKAVVVMAGDHGIVQEGVAAFPQEVTPQMVLNFLAGGAAINVLSRHVGARVVCVDIGVISTVSHPGLIVKKVKTGTNNMAKGPAMSREEAVKALEVGIDIATEQVRNGCTLLATGDMGIGNTTPSTAILAALTGLPVGNIVGRGTGVDDHRLALKIKAIERALEVNQPNPKDGLDILAKVGGLEIGGLAGVILGAAATRTPVVIDGFISTAAALIAATVEPRAKDYMIASHVSEEPGHKHMLDYLQLPPMLHMKMRLGEGTGAVLAFNLVEAATKILHEMATFADAGISGAL